MRIKKEFTENQLALFRSLSKEFIKHFNYPIIRHLCNTSGVLNYPDAHFDMVRCGIGLYGYGNFNKNDIISIFLPETYKVYWDTSPKECINKMEKDLMPNLRENIVEDFYLTPDYFEKDLNTKHGSGFSIQPKFSQSAYFRFHNKSEICDGLYFVGAGTHPGAGVPGVLSSAKVLDKIL